MKLLVGLGNPGPSYKGTRHNVGFRVVDLLAGQLKIALAREEAQSLTGRGSWVGQSLLLVKPQTWMNNSGDAVQRLVHYYRVDLSDLLVIYDDLDLALGQLRMRPKGSAGGHNGVRSIIEYLHTDLFARLRLGIGRVPAGTEGAEYVLARPRPDEALLLETACQRAAEACLLWAEHGIDQAMAHANSRAVGGSTD